VRLTIIASAFLLLSATVPAVAPAQGTQTGSTQEPARGVVVRRGPVSSASAADTLVECVPITTPAKTTPAAKPVRRRPRPRPRPRPAATTAPKPKPKPKVAAKPAPKHVVRKHVATRRRPVAAVASNAPKRANLPALVMCRPIHPVTPNNLGPLPETMVPIPQVAAAEAPIAAPLPVEEVPSYIVAAGPHSRFLPLALIPAFFIPFIHGGHTNHTATVDTTTPPPVIPPPPPPPTTVPEPSSLAMLGTGLLALGGATVRRRRKRRDR